MKIYFLLLVSERLVGILNKAKLSAIYIWLNIKNLCYSGFLICIPVHCNCECFCSINSFETFFRFVKLNSNY